MRLTGTLNPAGQGGAGPETYEIYRLWDAVFEECDSGMRFQLFPDGRVVMKNWIRMTRLHNDGTGHV